MAYVDIKGQKTLTDISQIWGITHKLYKNLQESQEKWHLNEPSLKAERNTGIKTRRLWLRNVISAIDLQLMVNLSY